MNKIDGRAAAVGFRGSVAVTELRCYVTATARAQCVGRK